MLEKKGAWIKVNESVKEEMEQEGIDCPEQFQGRQKVFDFLEENQKFTDLWFNRFKEVYSGS